MRLFWLILMLCAGAQDDRKSVPLTAAADLAGWVASGAARAVLPPFRSGRLEHLFDGDAQTFVRCGENGRAEFTFVLPGPHPLTQIGVSLGGRGVCRWRAAVSAETGPGDTVLYEPLFPWRYVEGGGRDPVMITGSGTVRGLKIQVERLTLGNEILLQEIEYYTAIHLVALRLDGYPARPRLGGAFRFSPMGIDRFGGRLLLDEGVRWRVRPEGLLKVDKNGLCTPLHAGKAAVGFSFMTLESPEYLLTAAPPAPAPTGLNVTPFPTSVRVDFETGDSPCGAYAVYARRDGETPVPDPRLVIGKSACTIDGLHPETAYHFAVAGLDEKGLPVTERSEEVRVRTLKPGEAGICRIANVRVLVPIYDGGFEPKEIEALIRGFELGRSFIFRSSSARLNLDTCYRIIEGIEPPTRTPGMENLVKDLRERGELIVDFDALHAATSDRTRNFSGYLFPDGAVGSLGAGAWAPYPGCDPSVDYSACWTLVHELQHSLDLAVSDAWESEAMLYGHFLDNYPLPPGQVFDAGAGYDGQRELFQRFEKYLSLPPPWSGCLEARDADGDGLPDQDGRLPADEARLRSDPGKTDTDGDGANDLEEFCAGLYGGSDPCSPDTDGDGAMDGADPFPLSTFSGRIPRGTPRRGEVPAGLLSRDVFYSSTDPPPGISVHASWDPGFLYLAFESDRPLRIIIHIDGSGRLGRHESDRRIGAPPTHAEEAVPVGSDVYSGDSALEVFFGSPVLKVGQRSLEGARIQSMERKGKKMIWMAIPAALGPGTTECHIRDDAEAGEGLTLEAGRILGLAFTARPLDGSVNARSEFEGEWYSLYETHRFYDAILCESQ